VNTKELIDAVERFPYRATKARNAEILTRLRLLERITTTVLPCVEWSGIESPDIHVEFAGCPACGGVFNKHKDGCELAAALSAYAAMEGGEA
jgi:hypothetical protein